MSSATNVICHGVLLSTISRAALESSRSRSAASRHPTSAAGDQSRPPQAVQAECCAYGCPYGLLRTNWTNPTRRPSPEGDVKNELFQLVIGIFESVRRRVH